MDAVLDLLHTLAQPEVQSAIAASAHSRGKQIGDTVSGNGIQISSNSAPTGGLETGRGTTAASGGQEMEEARNSSNREGNQDDSRVDGGEPFRFVSLAERRSASLGFSTDRHSSNAGRGHIRGDVTDVSGSRDLRTDRSRSCSRDRSPPHSRSNRSPPRYRSASCERRTRTRHRSAGATRTRRSRSRSQSADRCRSGSRSGATHESHLSARGRHGHGSPWSPRRRESHRFTRHRDSSILALVLALVHQNLTIVTPTVLVAHVRHPTTRLPKSIAVVAARASILRG